jgi:hypothetical protein
MEKSLNIGKAIRSSRLIVYQPLETPLLMPAEANAVSNSKPVVYYYNVVSTNIAWVFEFLSAPVDRVELANITFSANWMLNLLLD